VSETAIFNLHKQPVVFLRIASNECSIVAFHVGHNLANKLVNTISQWE